MTVLTTNEMYADRYKLRKLMQESDSLGDKIIRIEKMLDLSKNESTILLCTNKIESLSFEQDVVQEKISDLLSKYSVTYSSGTEFTVKSGNKYFNVFCHDDGGLDRMSTIVIER